MMVLYVVLIMSLSFFLFVLVAFSSESSLCIFTILFKMGCLAAVAYSATVNTVITINMGCLAAVAYSATVNTVITIKM